MHRVKNLNFSACLLELHSIFHVLFLPTALHRLLVALHPLTGIEQIIYRWKADVNTQLSRVDHFFILATILKSFFISNSFTVVVKLLVAFQLNFCHVFSFVIFSSISRCYTYNIPFVQISLTIYFLTFSDRGLQLTQMIFLPF